MKLVTLGLLGPGLEGNNSVKQPKKHIDQWDRIGNPKQIHTCKKTLVHKHSLIHTIGQAGLLTQQGKPVSSHSREGQSPQEVTGIQGLHKQKTESLLPLITLRHKPQDELQT